MKKYGALRDLLPFAQFKKREKHPWRSANFRKVAGFKPATLLKLTLLHGCFSRFLNCTNGTKSRNASHLEIGGKYNDYMSVSFHWQSY